MGDEVPVAKRMASWVSKERRRGGCRVHAFVVSVIGLRGRRRYAMAG